TPTQNDNRPPGTPTHLDRDHRVRNESRYRRSPRRRVHPLPRPALYTPLRPVQYPPGMMRTHSLRMSRHVLGPLPSPPAPATAARSRRAAPEQSLESSPVESPALTTCRAQPPRRYDAVLPVAPASTAHSSLDPPRRASSGVIPRS